MAEALGAGAACCLCHCDQALWPGKPERAAMGLAPDPELAGTSQERPAGCPSKSHPSNLGRSRVAMLRPPQALVALWCGSITVATRLLSLLLIDSLTSGHVAQTPRGAGRWWPESLVPLPRASCRRGDPHSPPAVGVGEVGATSCPHRISHLRGSPDSQRPTSKSPKTKEMLMV